MGMKLSVADVKKNNFLGENKKQLLVANFELTPVSHTTLLNNQVKTCICGKPVSTEYYVFMGTHRDSKKKVIFNAGGTCSNTLIDMSNGETLPLVNIQNIIRQITDRNINGGKKSGRNAVSFSRFNTELMKAISLYCAANTWYPYTIGDISYYTVRWPMKDNTRGVEWFNTRLIKDDTSISQIISSLAEENEIREFTFPLLREYLENKVDNCRIDM